MSDPREAVFTEAAFAEFGFLEADWDLRPSVDVEVDGYERFVTVQYRGDRVSFEIGVDTTWYDVWATISDVTAKMPGEGMWALEILAPPEQRDKRAAPRRWSTRMPGDALSEEEIRSAVSWYAALLRRYADEVLGGDFALLEAKEAHIGG